MAEQVEYVANQERTPDRQGAARQHSQGPLFYRRRRRAVFEQYSGLLSDRLQDVRLVAEMAIDCLLVDAGMALLRCLSTLVR